MNTLYINGCGAVTRHGIFSATTHKLWDPTQTSIDSIRRDQVLSTPLPLFGKLCFPDKLAFSAASLALEGITDLPQDRSGIAIAVPYGSLTTDMFFMESALGSLPSPAYFSATLPSSTIADIAIFYKFKGPDRVFCGGNSPVYDALTAAVDLLFLGKASVVLFCAVWAIDPANRAKLSTSNLISDAAFALLLSSAPLTTQAQPGRLVNMQQSAAGSPIDDYNFCLKTVECFRDKKKDVIPFTDNGTENYFEIL
ncbi:MAG: hypothetical protein ACM31E_00810 [Fibrobacterota bacterium]|nr:hypothetical protein [Chitinispirillaceae bacterium]